MTGKISNKDKGIYHADTNTITLESDVQRSYIVPEKYRGRFNDGQKVLFSMYIRNGVRARSIETYS